MTTPLLSKFVRAVISGFLAPKLMLPLRLLIGFAYGWQRY